MQELLKLVFYRQFTTLFFLKGKHQEACTSKQLLTMSHACENISISLFFLGVELALALWLGRIVINLIA